MRSEGKFPITQYFHFKKAINSVGGERRGERKSATAAVAATQQRASKRKKGEKTHLRLIAFNNNAASDG